MKDMSKHPCFNSKSKHQYGRLHIPVAPSCNIQCKYCNRKYDCINESRPGVSSTTLNAEQSLRYVERIMEKNPNIAVIGIAGPGDAFATPESHASD
jgi:nitrogen fixation protein NifB